jgi:hypothetical protein
MSTWTPTREWEGQDAFLIGGGSSLTGFDFSQLKGRNTIGCNEAFRLGPDIIKYLIFGDAGWWHRLKWDIEKLPLRVVTNAPALLNYEVSNLLKMHRVRDGLAEGDTLAWNYSTGAAAINLAVSLGATQIYLLGYDLCQNPIGKSHWHARYNKVTKDYSFNRFMRGFKSIAGALSRYPNVSVFNVSDGSSKLDCFQTISFEGLHEALQPREVMAI